MLSSKLSLVLSTCIIACEAFNSVSAPAVVTAGSAFTVSVVAGPAEASFSSYRVYLDTMPPGYTGGPSCYLLNTTTISTTSVNVTVPADLGPDGDFYSVATREFPPADSNEYTFSGNFNLTGATGNWSDYEDELKGAPLWPADDLPCDAYNCARACAMASFPSDLTGGSDAYNTMKTCILNCPGVSVPTSTSSSASASSTTAAAESSVKGSSAASSTGTASTGQTSATVTGTSDNSVSQTSAAGAAATSKAVAAVDSACIPLLAAGGVLALIL